MALTEVSIMIHVAMVMFVLWVLSSLGCSHPIFFFVSLLYLYKFCSLDCCGACLELLMWIACYAALVPGTHIISSEVNGRYSIRSHRKMQFEERKYASQRRVLSDPESVRWLNLVVQRVWPICMEQIASKHLLLPIIPWFLEKYKPWTAVLVGLKFIPEWPFLKRVSVCFLEPPHFQMTVKPIFQHGLDVLELPGIAGWLDKILAVAFEQTLVEPNLLVVDVEKFASANPETWFTVDKKLPIAFVKLEIVEAVDMQPSDLNGLADPYVKGQLGPYRFRTKIQKKTLTPKWHEEFKIPISSWEAPNVLVISVYDKDHLTDDPLGDCIVKTNSLRDGQRHEKWLNLRNIKTGKLCLAITVLEDDNEKNSNGGSSSCEEEVSETTETMPPKPGMHNQDRDVSATWELRKRRNCDQETQLHNACKEVLTVSLGA